MTYYLRFLFVMLILCQSLSSRETIDFNAGWEFALEDSPRQLESIDSLEWRSVTVPHDWSMELPYSLENTAASTGFQQGGIGWYRKTFPIDPSALKGKVWVEFDGVYNHSTMWINGHKLGYRPNGYISFSYDLTEYLKKQNTIVVRVDRSRYVDSRWYTGSGIYRDVRLVKTSEVHIPQWGVRITTPQVYQEQASVNVSTAIETNGVNAEAIELDVELIDPMGKVVSESTQKVELNNSHDGIVNTRVFVTSPKLWSLENPQLYTAEVRIRKGEKLLDEVSECFGIRSIRYDADKGFFLNDKVIKFKGVNLHHDAGAVGAAVPRDIWFSRVKALKDMGCNAIRTAHNPHAPDLMDACDELGMLVLAEAFDEWNVPKDKSQVYLGDNAAPEEFAKAYPAYFDEWAERDLKALISRDYNHPSIIMWSIGNEIEWTFRYYQKSSSYAIGDLDNEYYFSPPDFDPAKILERMDQLLEGGEDKLLKIAKNLSRWVREEDTTRWVTCGSVHPSVGLASGYADVVDVIGFNYRAVEYEGAHEMYPDKKIYGSENWVTWDEWKAVEDKDYVGGIFVWTGFAYKGEAGPYPRKGLNISLFDYTGIKTARGHMFETMWKDEAKVYMTTYPLAESEYSYDTKGWSWERREYDPEAMSWLRLWEWDHYNEHWNYSQNESILVQAYTNCDQAELFLNGKSMGVKKLVDFDDGCMKWRVSYAQGELKLVGIDKGKAVSEYLIQSASEPTQVVLKADRQVIDRNGRNIGQVFVEVADENGVPVRHMEKTIRFNYSDGELRLRAIDNGSEYYVGSHHVNEIETYNGRAYAVFECAKGVDVAKAEIEVSFEGGESQTVAVLVE